MEDLQTTCSCFFSTGSALLYPFYHVHTIQLYFKRINGSFSAAQILFSVIKRFASVQRIHSNVNEFSQSVMLNSAF